MSLIAITGGIGAGKSVVSRILRISGYRVYDCDSEARRLMAGSDTIKQRIADEIHRDVIVDGTIDRARLSAIVFAEPAMLERLNSIVHHQVRCHLAEWYRDTSGAGHRIAFVETAILYESQLDTMVDRAWIVNADINTRIKRVMERNGITRGEVERRIASQQVVTATGHRLPVSMITNDGRQAVLPQVLNLLAALHDDQ